ncbi:MAG: hypothetical protein J5I91_05070 [Bacteroidetes bacterium]|nr:hypothetical protein [Bacteroidota bacterium]
MQIPNNPHLGFKYGLPKLSLSIFALMLYALVFMIYTFPLVQDFAQSFISPPKDGDSPAFVWNVYNFNEAFKNGESLFYTHKQLYPIGGSTIMNSNITIVSLLNLIVNNPILSINIALLISFALSGLGAFFLTYRFTESFWGALLGGFIFSFAPYKVSHLVSHYNLMLTAVIPFFVINFNRAFEFESGRFLPKKIYFKWVVVCFLLGFVGLLSDYYTTFFMLYYAGIVWIYNAWISGKTIHLNRKTVLKSLVVIVIIHILLQQAKLNLDDNGAFWLGGNVIDFFVPSHNSLWFGGQWLQNFKDSFHPEKGSVEYEMFLGWTLIVVLFYVWYKTGKNQFQFSMTTFTALIFLAICVPAVRVFNIFLFNMPTASLHFIPFFNHIHVPTRFVVMACLFLPIIIVHYFKNHSYSHYFFAILLSVLFVEYYPKPYSTLSERDVPDWVYELKESDAELVIPVPTGLRDGIKGFGYFNSNQLFYQTIHGKTILGGYLSRLPESTFEYYRDSLGLDANGYPTEKTYKMFPNAYYINEQ